MTVLPHKIFLDIPLLRLLKLITEPQLHCLSHIGSFQLKFSAYGIPYCAVISNLDHPITDRRVKEIYTDQITRVRGKKTVDTLLSKHQIDHTLIFEIDLTKQYDPFQL
jgi:hypothetical protein